MKTILKILLISISLYACKGKAKIDNAATENKQESIDSAGMLSPENVPTYSNQSDEEPAGTEKERSAKLMATLLASKKEINSAMDIMSDSLSKSGLRAEDKLLYQKTMVALERSSLVVNRQIEKIIVTDLQNTKSKLSEVVQKMKTSEKELSGMIARLDKISGLIQIATTLVQSLTKVPIATPLNSGQKPTAK